MSILEGYQPKVFFDWFGEIAKIPRPSYHEEKICDFLEAFARDRGFFFERDGMNNILIRVPASEGYEQVPSFLLQSHVDMVTVAEEGVSIDFLKDPIKLQVIGNELRAVGTTLGMDDGGGMAAMLACADDPSVKHPELELLFTVQEEVGMGGIRQFDMHSIKSRRMINFDSGRTHNLCVSSAGNATFTVNTDLPQEAAKGAACKIRVFGGLGGHAGLDIHKNRACGVNVMGELLHMLAKHMPVQLSETGTTGAAIFPGCDSVILIPVGRTSEAEELLRQAFAKVKKRYAATEPNLDCSIEWLEGDVNVLSERDSRRVLDLMLLFRTGIKKCDDVDQTIVMGSGSMVKMALKAGKLDFSYAVRAIEDDVRDIYGETVCEILRLLGFEWKLEKLYGGWPMQSGSKIVELFDRKHQELFGYLPGHRFVHGGIEVGFISSAISDMEAIAMNLPMANAHTTNELLYLDQVPEFWQLLTAVLAAKE